VDAPNLRVLIVDDNATNRQILHKTLTSWGIQDGVAEGGEGALQMLRTAIDKGEPYDVAVLDMQMPEMDGLDLTRAIKNDPAIAPTRLMLLTSIGLEIREEARQVGVEVVLSKPVRQRQLHDALATMVGLSDDRPTARSPRENSSAVAHVTGVVEEPPPRGYVLLAEDNPVNQRVATRMLEKLGYRVDVAANGREALKALPGASYAAVLMDVQMPEMDGYETTHEIRRREGPERSTPIIAMTANAMEGDREKAIEAGMDDYVAKPVNREQLAAVLERWIPKEEIAPTAPKEGEVTPVAEETAEPLDRAVVENLRTLGGTEMLSELAQMFQEDARSALVGLRRAIQDGDAHSVERIAHTLKGSSGSMGATRMSQLCSELQDVGASADLVRASALSERLEGEFENVWAVLKIEVGG
jgi:CheY-like chemotaxis protein/HPt (histidine-containing phosphotransfer) domain-containing protein